MAERARVRLADSGRVSLNGTHVGRVIKLNPSTHGAHDARGVAIPNVGPFMDPWDAADAIADHYLKSHPVPSRAAAQARVPVRMDAAEIAELRGLLPVDHPLQVRLQMAADTAAERQGGQ